MSETAATTSSKPSPMRADTDRQALAQVEKWLAIIREISGEPQGQTIVPSDDPPATR
jgi:hypothetical protein